MCVYNEQFCDFRNHKMTEQKETHSTVTTLARFLG